VRPEGLGNFEKIHLIGTRPRDLPVCSTVPQPLRYRMPHIFLTSALVGGEWSASRPGRRTHWIGDWVDPRARRGEEKILDPTGTRTPDPRSSIPLPVAIPTTLYNTCFTILKIFPDH
jgi:hypothetical protein